MTDYILPPWLKCAKVGWRPRDSSGVSRPEFGGPIRTAGLAGDRLGATLEFTPQGTSSIDSEMERATMIALRTELVGPQNRA